MAIDDKSSAELTARAGRWSQRRSRGGVALRADGMAVTRARRSWSTIRSDEEETADAPDQHHFLVHLRPAGHGWRYAWLAPRQPSRRPRRQSVVDDLIGRGLDSSRIRAVGKGEGEPIASNADEAGRSLNRRVEVERR